MSLSTEVVVKGLDEFVAGLDALPAGLAEAASKAMRAATLLVEAEAKARVHRRTGRLFSSIASEVTDEGGTLQGLVYTDVEYAPDVEHGTSPHDILPHGRALMLPISPMAGGGGGIFGGAKLSGAPRAGQQVAFFTRVHHPGTKAMPFMKPALEENVGRISDIFQKALTAALEEAATHAA